MTDRIELFERRNRMRIVALVILATLNYIIAALMAAIAFGITIVVAALLQGAFPEDSNDFVVLIIIVVGGSAVIGTWLGLFRIPFLRRRLERKVLTETGARIISAEEQTEVEKLDASMIRHVSRATAPLWLEFPAHVLGPFPSRTTERLAREVLFDERIDHLCELAGQPARR